MAETDKEPKKTTPADCACVRDPFADLPPELQPRSKPRMGNLRQVNCPGCGLNYWTNRSTDLCVECKKKGTNIPK